MSLEFRGIHQQILDDTSYALDVEGALSSGKTTVCLWKELEKLRLYPGMRTLLARWTDDGVDKLLRPSFEQIARIHGTPLVWNEKQRFYECPNGSTCFAFGLKTQSNDENQRFGKLRGPSFSRVYVDQAEQLPADYLGELILRLRPDIEARQRGEDFPRQITYSPNPGADDGPMARLFPDNNRIKGRRYYAVSIFDNAHNLHEDIIENALIAYPPEHPKHRTMVLGLRGMNVDGEPVYENLFDREAHVVPLEWKPTSDAQYLEAFEFGRHNPVWLLARRTPQGALQVLGGVMGSRLMLEDFLPIVSAYREEWAGHAATFRCCASPAGEATLSSQPLLSILNAAGFKPTWRANANGHDVRLTMIETIAGLLRRRVIGGGEAFAIAKDPTRWLKIMSDGTVKQIPFLSYAFEGGYIWSKHVVSVSNKAVRQPHDDDQYANAMRCVENLVLNFCTGQPASTTPPVAAVRYRPKSAWT